MNITILGCGRWGTFLAWYFNKIGYDVLLWGRESSEKIKKLKETEKNEYVDLSAEITLSSSLSDAIAFSDDIIIAIEEQNLRNLMIEIVCENYFKKTFILCMKGIENATFKRLSEVVYEFVDNNAEVAIMVGPGQPFDLFKGTPTCMIIDSINDKITRRIVKDFSSNLIRFYAGNDLIGNEIGAAANKVIGIAGGILDGLGYTALKGILMVIGTKEISNIIKAMGGNPNSAYGLCCLGDYQASMFSEYSNSIAYGRSIVSKMKFTKHAPGSFTAEALINLANRYDVSIPLLSQISLIINNKKKPTTIIEILLDYNKWSDFYENI